MYLWKEAVEPKSLDISQKENALCLINANSPEDKSG